MERAKEILRRGAATVRDFFTSDVRYKTRYAIAIYALVGVMAIWSAASGSWLTINIREPALHTEGACGLRACSITRTTVPAGLVSKTQGSVTAILDRPALQKCGVGITVVLWLSILLFLPLCGVLAAFYANGRLLNTQKGFYLTFCPLAAVIFTFICLAIAYSANTPTDPLSYAFGVGFYTVLCEIAILLIAFVLVLLDRPIALPVIDEQEKITGDAIKDVEEAQSLLDDEDLDTVAQSL